MCICKLRIVEVGTRCWGHKICVKLVDKREPLVFLFIKVGHYEDSLKEKKIRMIVLSNNGFLFRVGEAR